jgi:Fe-S-cluster containining protein
LCRNYENRPNMCRSYPDGGECNYRGCTRRCESKPINAEKMLKDEKLEEAIL